MAPDASDSSGGLYGQGRPLGALSCADPSADPDGLPASPNTRETRSMRPGGRHPHFRPPSAVLGPLADRRSQPSEAGTTDRRFSRAARGCMEERRA